jgi:flagellar biosynthetic protein FlhB
MADGTDADRTEEPTARRLQQARERGQVPRSQELGNFATMIGGSAVLVATGAHLAARLAVIMESGLKIDPESLSDPQTMLTGLGTAMIDSILLLLPILGALVVLILAAALSLGGWNFSPQALAPDFTRLSPLAGIKRLFGLRGFSDLLKALLKCLVVGAVCAAVCVHLFRDVLALGHMTPRAAIGRGAYLLGWAFVCLCGSLAVVAVVDVPLQIFQFHKSLRMTKQELRDEAKDSEGRPETKRRIRQMQQQLARRRMMHKVPTADVVIVNPTHFAVALKYDPAKMRAPRVLAKGVDLVALNIRRIAEQHRVPVFDSPRLARALYRTTEIDKEIPTALYMAAAQVLSYVFRIRAMNPTLAARVVRPDPKVDDESGDAEA